MIKIELVTINNGISTRPAFTISDGNYWAFDYLSQEYDLEDPELLKEIFNFRNESVFDILCWVDEKGLEVKDSGGAKAFAPYSQELPVALREGSSSL